jgi:hypothetical protein
LRQQQGGGGGDQIDVMQSAWQQALALAERHLARGHWVVRSMLTHLRALLVGARPMRAVPAVRVQARVLASMAAGLLGAGAFDDDHSNSSDNSNDNKQKGNDGSRRVPHASSVSVSVSMAAAVADSASPLLRLALPPRSTLIDVDSHALAQRAFDAAPVFALATHGELLADLLALVAAALRRQEQQQSSASASSSSSAGSAPPPAAMSTGLFADAARYFARALNVFERGGGALGADAVRVRGKLAECAQAELSFATADDQADADLVVVAAMKAAAELEAADGAAKAALAAAASRAKSELAVVETPNARLLREIRIDLFLGMAAWLFSPL